MNYKLNAKIQREGGKCFDLGNAFAFRKFDAQNDPYSLNDILGYDAIVPYFWDGKYMSCRDKKRFQYYGKFEKLLYFLSDEDRIGISSELKKLKGESR